MHLLFVFGLRLNLLLKASLQVELAATNLTRSDRHRYFLPTHDSNFCIFTADKKFKYASFLFLENFKNRIADHQYLAKLYV